MPSYLPAFDSKLTITLSATAAVTGGRLVMVSGDGAIAHATADAANVVGVAMDDALESQPVAVSLGGVQRLLADGSVTAGSPVFAADGGKASTSGSANPVGIALTSGESAPVSVLMNR